MAFKSGKDTLVYVGSTDFSSYLSNADVNKTADVAETTTFSDEAKTYIGGLTDGTISLAGFWDATADATLSGLMGSATTSNILIGYDGVDTGDYCNFAKVDATNYGISSPVGDVVAVTVDLQATGGVFSNGYILSNSAVTATGVVGSALDNSASSSAGAGAFVICTSVSGTSPTADIKIQHSADNVTYVDLITFTQVTGATSEIKTVDSGTTINRYVRIYNTIGGSSTPTANVIVGFARNS
jgi:hypothetical protein